MTQPKVRSNVDPTHPEPAGAEPANHLDPAKIRVVDVQLAGTNEIVCRDCYDPNGGDVEPGDLLRFEHGELWLRTLDWAHAATMEAEPCIRWMPTGLSRDEVGTIQVFAWPRGERVPMTPQERMN